MSPREKGRYLKSKGWKPVLVYGNRRNWWDPLNPQTGARDTHEAYRVQKSREKDGAR